ncbi:FAD-binding oxidoreductase [Escherichia coli]|nr:FAD-binding oxidoreductase [Escherichia coli]
MIIPFYYQEGITMSLSRAAIVDQLKEIVGADRVITDETVLKKNSIDRFRKFPDIHGIYTLPIPAAVVKLGSTEQVSRVLNFMNAHKINGVPRTGASATEGGLETVVENSVVLDGSAMNQIINIDIENMQATAQCGVPLEVLENALREKVTPRAFSAVKAAGADGRPGSNPQYRAVLHTLRRNRRYGRWSGSSIG